MMRLLPVLASIVGLSILALLLFLISYALPVFLKHYQAVLVFTWAPEQGHIGILAMVLGSACIALLALVIAYPIAIGLVCFLLVYRHTRLARFLRRMIRFMAGIPTVVYGICAIFLLLPLLRETLSLGSGFSLFSAALMLSLLILPVMVMTLENQAQLMMQPLWITSAALGLSPWQALRHLWFVQSRHTFLASALLGFSRALGDTMLPLMLAGNAPQIPMSVFDSVRSLTAHISLVLSTAQGSQAHQSLFAAGFLLLCFSVLIQLLIRRLLFNRRQLFHRRQLLNQRQYNALPHQHSPLAHQKNALSEPPELTSNHVKARRYEG
ncbi:hypothetical protein VST7929_02912 [Vibrio stylophorae]|uniref:ABC transmembrane type-1 domain-containing protein n=1 Tax=Vibrio stylophorae TaxID=659351 RepID=A0ABN8DVV0_9VIBR|nr:ABC transporter permease subunit [Vibrio stylophorae]CAH0535294.1 hypothetical protein VST7929_02912 [Vibrio stylophorae]